MKTFYLLAVSLAFLYIQVYEQNKVYKTKHSSSFAMISKAITPNFQAKKTMTVGSLHLISVEIYDTINRLKPIFMTHFIKLSV